MVDWMEVKEWKVRCLLFKLNRMKFQIIPFFHGYPWRKSVMWRNFKFWYMTNLKFLNIYHIEKIQISPHLLHLRLFCCKIAIYAVLSQNLFFCDWVEKIDPKIVPEALASPNRQKKKTAIGRWFWCNFSVGVVDEFWMNRTKWSKCNFGATVGGLISLSCFLCCRISCTIRTCNAYSQMSTHAI